MTRAGTALAAACAAILAVRALAGPAEAGRATLEVAPLEATVGERVRATLTLDLPSGTRIEPPAIGAVLGPFAVSGGAWHGPTEEGGRSRWTWTASLAAYDTGRVEVPSIEVTLAGPSGPSTLRTEPIAVTIRSVLPPEDPQKPDDAQALADLKNVATVPPNYRPLTGALAVVGLLLLLSAVAWWIQRRYAAKLAAVAAPDDPFHRVPPHVWAYEELQRLLDRRLAEEGQVETFFAELARILKRYLGGRFRVELMERTTSEVVPLLRQAGAPANPAAEARALLDQCDLVKFARISPLPEACRKSVEQAYRIVDLTRPVEEAPADRRTQAAGAA